MTGLQGRQLQHITGLHLLTNLTIEVQDLITKGLLQVDHTIEVQVHNQEAQEHHEVVHHLEAVHHHGLLMEVDDKILKRTYKSSSLF